jgi:O-antigen ligase
MDRLSPMASTKTRSRPKRGFSFWVLVIILVFSPLPFASVAPVWSHLYSVLVGLAIIAYVTGHWRKKRPLPAIPQPLRAAGILVGLVALWGYVQTIPGLLPDWQHPIWSETAALFGQPNLSGCLSLIPEESRFVATNYLTYLGFGLLVIWHCRYQRNLDLLLTLFVGTQAAYALYGLLIYFSGQETILWFDKTAYIGNLTSTFVNRNSYATYAGFGTLATLALILRFLRHSLSPERSYRSLVREFLETFTSKGWVMPVILLMCLAAILLTQSRMGLTAALVAGNVLLVGWIARLPPGRTRTLGIAVLVLLIVLLIVNFVLSGGLTTSRFSRLFEDGDGRFAVYPLMLDAIRERPLTGYGLGSFESAFRLVRDETISASFTRGHSDYLEVIMDVGWPAACCMFAAFLTLLIAAWYATRLGKDLEPALLAVAATIQVALHSMVDFSLQIPAVVFAYLLVALAAFGAWSKAMQAHDGAD